MRLLLFIITFSLSFVCFSQAGYMGKRFSAGYGLYFSPALFNPNAQGNTIFGRGGNSNDLSLAFNSQHEVYGEFVLSNRFSLGLSARFFKTAYDNKKEIYAQKNVVDANGYTDQIYYEGAPEGLYYIKGANYSLYSKMFNRRYVAPWGRYTMFGVTVRRYSCYYDPSEMYVKYNKSYGYYNNAGYANFADFGPQKQSFTKFDFLFGFGRTRVIANRVIMDYGFNVNFFAFMTGFFDTVDLSNDGAFFDRYPKAEQYMEKTNPWRLRGFNRFNAFLKVGVLLF
ncbi:MAG: hypothetical protein V4677_15100 [Bacteroidota bacterium]